MSEEKPTESPAEPASAPEKAEAPKPARRRKGRGWLLLIAAAVAGAGWLYATGRATLPDALRAWLHGASPASPEAPVASRRNATPPVAPAPLPAPKPAAHPARAPLDSAEAEALMQAMESLQARLDQEAAARAALQEELQKERRANLITRLRLIVDPASRLPQIRLAWEEIALTPGLTDDERATARDMAALARKDEAALNAWRAELARHIDALRTPVAPDVLPRPEHPWLAWAVGQFHLRPANAPAERETRALRRALEDAARKLALEAWPEAASWRSLRARLLLKLEAMQEASPALGLPDDFSGIQADTERLRAAAGAWLNRLLPEAAAEEL